MVDPMDDIARQARQGSVSAIIQVLNEKLTESGVRTRAMLSQSVLQLLCEAATVEQLEQSVLVPQVRKILESIQPKRIRRVNINSRIVREQQLLWLDEINRDPENHLLWSEEITLNKPHLWQRLTQDWRDSKSDLTRAMLPKGAVSRLSREKQQFWRGILGGAGLSLLMIVLGGLLYNWFNEKNAKIAPQVAASSNSIAPQPSTPSPANRPVDPFAEAVRLAEQTVVVGQKARTSSEWLEVATRWQKASDLMQQVPATDARHATAQNRVVRYRQNSESAVRQAKGGS